ncbi:hypothetical protein C2845_PM06G01040 [Panicum miliaceum]|uniref:Uncharacterized protein n=1 Tax=Panicum miliaceum TaxID=4540 RepID=A0A3L6RB11_PANMI|nr:hypothetical protein C2845_PM06G01040 [Panicum miliaceum]
MKKSRLHEIDPQEEHPDRNMNLDLNISNQPMQHSKNSTATPRGFTGVVVPVSPAAGPELAAAHAGSTQASCAAAPELPRPPSRAAGLVRRLRGLPHCQRGILRRCREEDERVWGRLGRPGAGRNRPRPRRMGREWNGGGTFPRDLAR